MKEREGKKSEEKGREGKGREGKGRGRYKFTVQMRLAIMVSSYKLYLKSLGKAATAKQLVMV